MHFAIALVPFLLTGSQVLGAQANERRVAAALGDALEPRNIWGMYKSCPQLSDKLETGTNGFPGGPGGQNNGTETGDDPAQSSPPTMPQNERRDFGFDGAQGPPAGSTGGPAPTKPVGGPHEGHHGGHWMHRRQGEMPTTLGSASPTGGPMDKHSAWCSGFSAALKEHLDSFQPNNGGSHFGPPGGGNGPSGAGNGGPSQTGFGGPQNTGAPGPPGGPGTQ